MANALDADRDGLDLGCQIAAHFPVCGQVLDLSPLGQGLINQTYEMQATGGCFVLQRINGSIFRQPQRIMDNLVRLQHALAQAGEAQAPRLPRFFPTASGDFLAYDAQGGAWRLLERIPAAAPLAEVSEPAQAAEIGRVLGCFHHFGARLPVTAFHITLPPSGDRADYLVALEQALTQAQKIPADSDVLALVERIRKRASALNALQRARAAGQIEDTLVHGDPKRDNILFDTQGQRALCLIDLDTVQPGLILRDLGDCLRSCCNRAGESACPEQTRFDLGLAEALLSAYVRAAPGRLQPASTRLLFDAIRQIPLELGARFLLDHLRGDPYFRVRYRGENLHKARVQLALVADIERQKAGLDSCIERFL